jgi:hypothetical protein
MILILKRISPSTLVPDIECFIAPALKGGLLTKQGKLENITVQVLKEPGTDKTEYNALVRVEPVTVGKRVIKLLNRKALKGKPINVSEYHFRHRDNDRRNDRNQLANDRRRQDRRRLGLSISDITEQRKSAIVERNIAGWNTDITL